MDVVVDTNYCSQLVSSFQRKLTETLREHQKLSIRLRERPEETLEIRSAQLVIQKEIIRISAEQKIITDIMRTHKLKILRMENTMDGLISPRETKDSTTKGTPEGICLRSGTLTTPPPLTKPPEVKKKPRSARKINYESKSSVTDSSEIDTPIGSPPSSSANTDTDVIKVQVPVASPAETKTSKKKRKKQMRHVTIMRAASELKRRQLDEPKQDPDELMAQLFKKYDEKPQELHPEPPMENHPSFFMGQNEFLRSLGLITWEEHKEITEAAEKKRVERRRRTTANPKYTNGLNNNARGSVRLRKKKTDGGPMSPDSLCPNSPAYSLISSSNEDNECYICSKIATYCNLMCISCGLCYHADCIRVSGSKARVPDQLLSCPKCVRDSETCGEGEVKGVEEPKADTPKIPRKRKSSVEKKTRIVVRKTLIMSKDDTEENYEQPGMSMRTRMGEHMTGAMAGVKPVAKKSKKRVGSRGLSRRKRRVERARSQKGKLNEGIIMQKTMLEMAAAANIVMSQSPMKHSDGPEQSEERAHLTGDISPVMDEGVETLVVVASPEPNVIEEELDAGSLGVEFLEKAVDVETSFLVPGSPPMELEQKCDETGAPCTFPRSTFLQKELSVRWPKRGNHLAVKKTTHYARSNSPPPS